jgi:hypothetical protein
MRTMPGRVYGGYNVVANALPAPENRYYSAFSVHEYQPNVSVLHLPIVYQEGITEITICETAEQAHEDAFARAREWIDQHPAA